MGKSLDWVREEATGRLFYRRVYPEALRPFLQPRPKRELKDALGANRTMTIEAFRRYEEAQRRFDRDVKAATAARQLQEKEAADWHDVLTPELIAHLVGVWRADELGLDEEARWTPRPRERKLAAHRNLKAGITEDLEEARQLRALGDLAGIVSLWGGAAIDHAELNGSRVDRADPRFVDYVRALHDAVIATWEAILQRLEGLDVPTPPAPPRPDRPANPRGRARTASALLDAYKAAKWEGWSQSSRTALEPVFRLLRDAIGDHEVRSVDRTTARSVLELVEALPSGLGRKGELKGLTVLEAVEEGRRLGLPTIGPGTANRGYMVHVSAIFGWAVKEEWADRNPFVGLTVADPVDARDKRDPFTIAQLQTLFHVAPWTAPGRLDDPRPGAFWVPLIALFTGARLGEVAGLRVVDVEEIDDVPAFRIRPHEQRSLKNRDSRRDLPIHSALIRLGLLAFVADRKRRADPQELLFPDGKANVRGQSGAKLGERFGATLKERGITGTKLGVHSFRHNFEDRLKAAGLAGRAEALALSGRAVSGSHGDYGSGFAIRDLQAALERVSYPGLDLSHLEP